MKDDSKIVLEEKVSSSSMKGTFVAALKYAIRDSRKNRRAWVIGFITIVIVVFVIAFLKNAISLSPYIFFRLAEESNGELDLVLTPFLTNTSTTGFINHTYVTEALEECPHSDGTVPRWVIPARISRRDPPVIGMLSLVLALDTDKEENIGIGRGWKYRHLGEAECHVSKSLLRVLGVEEKHGERILINIDILEMLKTAGVVDQSVNASDREAAREFAELLGFDFNQTFVVNNSDIVAAIVPGVEVTGQTEFTGEDVFDILYPAFLAAMNFTAEYIVVNAVESPMGKYPDSIGNVVSVDSNYVMREFQASLRDAFSTVVGNVIVDQSDFDIDGAIDDLGDVDINAFAFMSIVMMKNREEVYVKDEKEMDNDMISFSNNVAEYLGPSFDASWAFPLAVAVKGTMFIRMFLDMLFNIVFFLMIVLGSLLIYSLLLSNVEEKTYEYGMLRALGMKNSSLFQVIIGQTMTFAIPGVCMGLFVAFLFSVPLALLLADYTITDPVIGLSVLAILFATAVGLSVPLFANVVPIRKALGKALRDALDVTHQAFSEVTVRMIKLEKLGLRPWQLALSLILVVIGFVVYYVIPYAFTFGDLPLFFLILTFILLGMLLGLCLIFYPFEEKLERVVLWCMVWRDDRKMLTLMRKSMAGHRKRTGKTALMFIISVAFIIFAGAIFALQARSIPMNIRALVGSDIVVQATMINNPIWKEDMIPFLEEESVREGNIIQSYSFATFEMQYCEEVALSLQSNLVGFPVTLARSIGVEKSYLESTYEEFFLITQKDESFSYSQTDGVDDIVKTMIETAGQAHFKGETPGYYPPVIITGIGANETLNTYKEEYLHYSDAVISEAVRYFLSVDTSSPLGLIVSSSDDQGDGDGDGERSRVRDIRSLGKESTLKSLGKPRGVVKKAPGFFGFSAHQILAYFAPVLISVDSFDRLREDIIHRDPSVSADATFPTPYQKLFIKVVGSASMRDREDLVNAIRNFVDSETMFVFNTKALVERTETATAIIMIFFIVVAAIASLLCFFMLWTSFVANVRSNSWEFGVIRSLGLSVTRLIRAYIYESLCLVISSFIFGTIIGVAVAVTLTLQFNLFLEMPFILDFPFMLFFFMLGMSLLIAVVGSYLPARSLKKEEIARVLRGI